MDLEVKLLAWGSSYGFRVRKGDVERLGLQPGQTLMVRIPDFTQPRDLAGMPSLRLGRFDHDAGFEA